MKEIFELQSFPFDVQPFNVLIRAPDPLYKIRFYYSDITESYILDHDIDGFTAQLQQFETTTEVTKDNKALFTFSMMYARSSIMYLFHVYLPLFILQTVCFCIVRLNPKEDFADIINILIIVLLTTTAFKFTLSSILPTVGYLMYIDLYFIFCYTLPPTLAAFDYNYSAGNFDLE